MARRPKVYVADHPSDEGKHRVMFRNEVGDQYCLVDDLEDKENAERIRKWVAGARPQTLREAEREARMAGR
jgi:isocitrate dehydrogenase